MGLLSKPKVSGSPTAARALYAQSASADQSRLFSLTNRPAGDGGMFSSSGRVRIPVVVKPIGTAPHPHPPDQKRSGLFGL